MRQQAMVANADSQVDACKVQDRCDDYGFPAEEEKRGDGSGVEDDHEEERDRVEGVALRVSA
jgi:hypothetical protein